jgi:hypothetical protein
MRNKMVLVSILLFAVTGILLAGCATGPSGSSTASQGGLLTQAGFKAHTANSPEKLAYIHTLPAKKVVLNQYNDKPLYLVCTEPDSKQCYLGDEAAYERYKQLAIQQSISEDQMQVQEHRWDPEAWNMWVDSQGGG